MVASLCGRGIQSRTLEPGMESGWIISPACWEVGAPGGLGQRPFPTPMWNSELFFNFLTHQDVKFLEILK